MELNVGIHDLKRGTCINDIVVPEQMKNRIRSGLDYFDDALGRDKKGRSGFMPGSVILFTGVPGGGKTTLMLQLASSLSWAQGENSVIFNTVEESLYQTKLMSERMRLEHGFIVGQDRIIDDVLCHANEINAKVVIIDSLQTMWDKIAVERGSPNTRTPIRVLQQATDWAKKHYKVVIMIGQVGKNGQFKGNNTLKHMVDVHMHLDVNQDSKGDIPVGVRLFENQKNRFGSSGFVYFLKMCSSGMGLSEIRGLRTKV